MGTVFGVAWSMMLTAGGAAVAAGASAGAAGLGQFYFAGHVLLGLGLGYFAVILLRVAVRRVLKSIRSRSVTTEAPDVPLATGTPDVALATVSVLPARPAAVPVLRGRHAA